MKKAALTFGLFSLVMVATSFATPETNLSSNNKMDVSFADGGGGATNQGRKKADFTSTVIESNLNNNQLNSFVNDSQSKRMIVKFD